MFKECKHTAKSFCAILVVLHLIILTILLFHAYEAYEIHQDLNRVADKVELLLDEAGITYEHLENSE